MEEDKTFRYGLIVLGFFLIMVGMFIMNVDKPEVFATFCSIGILMIVVGIIWSICQCYPKVTLVPPIESDTEHLFPQKHQISVSMSESGAPLKSSKGRGSIGAPLATFQEDFNTADRPSSSNNLSLLRHS
ncbi:barttin isoform X2 [Carcharodon carcharias]|uniref:barttin isoform X2 n=1 Tax=Carcharodon carcharias TaxID=13397 RepID=UPI001B7E1225|nr:barttin isoform X2 [Carcharodon carcharias]